MLLKLASAALMFGLFASAAGCYAEPVYVGPAAPSYSYGYATYDYPPATYIASTQPYYYGGRATYFYNNRWYYQDGGRWAYYRSEPAELGRYRARAYANPSRVYVRAHR